MKLQERKEFLILSSGMLVLVLLSHYLLLEAELCIFLKVTVNRFLSPSFYDLDSNLSFLVTGYLRMFCGFQVAASTNKEVDAHIPNYPSLHPQLICQLHNVTMHADVETDEVYAQMTLQPLNAV
jgi:hypothetical protein